MCFADRNIKRSTCLKTWYDEKLLGEGGAGPDDQDCGQDQRSYSYGTTISGLCASAGLGTLVLIKEDKEKNDVVQIIAMLLGISIASGLVIQYLLG